jgi:lipopolysaccharide transport system permease protein
VLGGNSHTRGSTELPLRVYNSTPVLREPRQLFDHMLGDLLECRHLAWRLLIRNLTSQYRQSLLGYFWVLFGPLLATLGFVFLNSQGILKTADTDIPYALYVFMGTLLWQVFTDSLQRPLQWLIQLKSILGRVNFPREAIVAGALGEVLVYFAIRFILLVLLLFAYGVGVSWTLWLAPFTILALVGLGLAIGILLAPLGLLLGDVERGLYPLLTVWFFATPVVYPPPTTWPASLINHANPVSPILITIRELLAGAPITQGGHFMIVSGATLLVLLISWVFFRLAMPHLVARVSG